MATDTQETKRHRLTINGIVAAVSLLIGGGGAVAGSRVLRDDSHGVTLDQVRLAISEELEPFKRELAITKLTAEQARSDATLIRAMLDREMSDIGEKVDRIDRIVAKLEERSVKP